jgi:curved DNA-binding protein CbpA
MLDFAHPAPQTLRPERDSKMTLMQDHYSRLGISPVATADLIKAAYRKKAAQFHPDKNPSPDAAARFREVQEAYEVLSDTQRRKAYDDYRQRSLIEDPLPVARDIAGKYIQGILH